MEPNQPGTQPMPNQPMPNQPAPEQPAPAMTMEEQAATAATGTMPEQAITQDTALTNGETKKKSKAGVLGMVLLAVIAIGGIAFGVMMMMQKDNQAKGYETQISSLKKTNSELTEQLEKVQPLNGDEALALLQEKAEIQQLPYKILNANVYAVYSGEEEKVAYWVTYASSIIVAPTTISTSNIIFTLDEETEEWDFSLPGFSTYTDAMAADYTVLE